MSIMMILKTIIINLFILLLITANSFSHQYYIADGPDGGTFILYAKYISTIASGRNIKMESIHSTGSIDNIRKVEKNEAQFAIAYSGHVFQAIKGDLRNDPHKYQNILAIGYLYGAAAQMALKVSDGIKNINQINNFSIGIGNKGSGAADTAELFFREIGLWQNITPYYNTYQNIVESFISGKIDAFWLFTSYPNPSISLTSSKINIKLIDVFSEAKKKQLFVKYPYYTKCIIPAKTYNNIENDVITFQDSAILIAHKLVSQRIVSKLTYMLYNPNGLKKLVKSPYVSEKLTLQKGINGVVTPLHPGAIAFWKKMGLIN